ncbi:MAG TPA: NAD(+)/NADH kinase [Candidatus Limenecus avicola]|uniref:NAD kinase n=1 Tax=Candidatus Limenecus avicola TaxID=2840847 RepID=A0A9D1SRI6_9CLOT|nr:NAD(+)/NADH kinase [Candidatus Limenecus avicola]
MKDNENLLSLKNISIVYNEDVAESLKVAQYTKEILTARGLKTQINSSTNFNPDSSLVITVGGDGTLLKAARYYAPINVPLLGINLGRLGFLAQANPDEIESSVDKLLNGEYSLQYRMMLSVFDDNLLALNDIVIKGDSFSRTSKLFLSINNKVVCDYLADGIIIATPTGSTAYTLSAGGPVMAPELEAVVIVPICPHTLTARPLVIPANETIKISSCKTCNKLKLSADGQDTIDINTQDSIVIKKSSVRAKLVILEKENNEFYSILRKKLKWGVSPER